jgi:hypothetical protein
MYTLVMFLVCRKFRGTSSSEFEEVKGNLLNCVVGKFHQNFQLGVIFQACRDSHGFPESAVLAMSPEGIFAEGGTGEDFKSRIHRELRV